MEHIFQRQVLRRPLTYVKYCPTWDVCDLDGGCDTWRRFQETWLPPNMKKVVYRRESEQFQSTLEKEAMAKDMWQQRAKDNADRNGLWLQTRENCYGSS